MEQLLDFDASIFLIINDDWSNAFFDFVLVPIRNINFWIPAYVLLVIYMIVKHKKRGAFCLLMLIGTLAISDATSSHLVKKTVRRDRPCRNVELQNDIHIRVHCGTGFSFTSSHATNHMAMGVFLFMTLGLLMKRWRWLFIFWAVSIGFAQIYVGVHYPLDVLSGFVLGGLIGSLMAYLFNLSNYKLIKEEIAV